MVKKVNLIVDKKIYNRVDEVFHNLFHKDKGLENSELELTITESISLPNHIFFTGGKYLAPRKGLAFKPIEDGIKWNENMPLVTDYGVELAKGLDSHIYQAQAINNNVKVKSNVSSDDVKKAIDDYIIGKGGQLTQGEFMDLTGANESELVKCFGGEHDTITRRQYSRNDILKFSNEFFKQARYTIFREKKTYKTHYKRGANILNIYREVLNHIAPEKSTSGQQGTLFG